MLAAVCCRIVRSIFGTSPPTSEYPIKAGIVYSRRCGWLHHNHVRNGRRGEAFSHVFRREPITWSARAVWGVPAAGEAFQHEICVRSIALRRMFLFRHNISRVPVLVRATAVDGRLRQAQQILMQVPSDAC